MNLVSGVIRISVPIYVSSKENIESNRFRLVNGKTVTQKEIRKNHYRALLAGMIGVTHDITLVAY